MSETPGLGDTPGRDPNDESSELDAAAGNDVAAKSAGEPELPEPVTDTETRPAPDGESLLTGSTQVDGTDSSDGDDFVDPEGLEAGVEPADDMAAPSAGTDSGQEVGEPQAAIPAGMISIWPVWAWTMVGVVLVVVGLGIGAGVLAKTLLLDVISFWPAFVVIVLVFAALIPRLRKGAPRLSAVLPLLLLTYLGVTVALHVARWDELPSTAADTFGPPVESVTDGRIELDLPGELVVRPADQPELYRVLMLNRGGDTGGPSALEIINDGEASISVNPRSDSGWFRSSGWSAQLSLLVTWEVEATAESFDIDLSAVSSGGLRAVGDGTIVLGFVRPGSVIELDGTIDLTVREGTRIDLIGSANVPDRWTTTGVGMESSGPADPYTITVSEGSIVTITER